MMTYDTHLVTIYEDDILPKTADMREIWRTPGGHSISTSPVVWPLEKCTDSRYSTVQCCIVCEYLTRHTELLREIYSSRLAGVVTAIQASAVQVPKPSTYLSRGSYPP